MDWTEESILRFIAIYRERPVLWDTNDPNYKLTSRKIDAWVEISKTLSVHVPELKRKMNSLLASYRRERQKAKSEAVRLGSEEAYESTWFAYKSFDFLRDKYQPRPSRHAQEITWSRVLEDDVRVKEEDAETFEYDEYNTGVIHHDQEGLDHRDEELEAFRFIPWTQKVVGHHKRKKPPEEAPAKRSRSDQYDAYGVYIAVKLRDMDPRSSAHVQKAIADILFQADMGNYLKESQPSPDVQNSLSAESPRPPDDTHTTDS